MAEMSVTAIVANYMSKYDHNDSGKIELKRPEGFWDKLKNGDETRRTTTSTTPNYELNEDNELVQDGSTMTTSVYSIDRLLFSADENDDQIVDREELEAAVKKYDTDNNDTLTSRGFFGFFKREPKGELDLFNDEVAERRTSSSSITI